MTVCPGCPLVSEIGKEHVAKRLAIVAHCLRVAIYKFFYLVFKSISATAAELVEEGGGPVGTIYFVTVVEEGMREWCTRLYKGFLDVCEIVCDGCRVEMVYHISLSTGSRTFYHLAGSAFKKGNDTFLVGCAVEGIFPDESQSGVFRLFCRQRKLDGVNVMFGVNDGIYKDSFACSLFDRNPWTSEGPSRTGSHSSLNVVSLVFLLNKIQHVHPLGG